MDCDLLWMKCKHILEQVCISLRACPTILSLIDDSITDGRDGVATNGIPQSPPSICNDEMEGNDIAARGPRTGL